MGLGKTVQVCSYLLARALVGELRPEKGGPALVSESLDR
jgi:SNF2 family DNA or RNA helicase